MQFVIHYEIATALFLIVFIALYFTKNHLIMVKNSMFQRLLITLLLVDLLDIASCLQNDLVRPGFIYAISILLFILQNMMMIYYVKFVMTLAELSAKSRRVVGTIIFLVTAVFDAMVITTPVTKLIFYVDPLEGYRYGPAHLCVYLPPFIFLLMGFFMLLTRYQHVKRSQIAAICLFNFVILGSTVMQAFLFPHILLSYFATALGLLVIYFTFQSPEYYLNQGSDIYNQLALSETVEERLLLDTPIYGVAILVENMKLLRESYSKVMMDQLFIQLKEYFEEFHRATVFYWDDIFCVLLGDKDISSQAADHMLERFQNPWTVSGAELSLSTSILLVDSPQNFDSNNEFFSILKYFHDTAAKDHLGRVMTFGDGVVKNWRRYEAIVKLLHTAIETDGISIHYQPIYAVNIQGFQSAEALVRLDHTGELGPISPEEFIPIAEQENLMMELGQLIFRKICQFIKAADLPAKGLSFIEVNLSVKQCIQKSLCAQLQEIIKEYGIAPSFLNFEVTETVYADVNSYILRNMEYICQLGCSFSLDDFGSGYANLNYLVDFTFKLVKLDKKLVWSYFKEGNGRARVILENTISMLQELGMEIVAEGVEDQRMMDRLIMLGVPYLQGFYFSKPLPEQAFLTFLQGQG